MFISWCQCCCCLCCLPIITVRIWSWWSWIWGWLWKFWFRCWKQHREDGVRAEDLLNLHHHDPYILSESNKQVEWWLDAEAQKPKTFRVATFYAQKLSGRSARNRSFASHDIVKECVMNVHAPPYPLTESQQFHPTGDQQEGPSLIRWPVRTQWNGDQQCVLNKVKNGPKMP